MFIASAPVVLNVRSTAYHHRLTNTFWRTTNLVTLFFLLTFTPLIGLKLTYPPANGENERSEICVVKFFTYPWENAYPRLRTAAISYYIKVRVLTET